MDADENGVAIRVSNCNARGQRHRNITVPGHDDAISARSEKRLEALRDIERHLFFWDPLTGNTAAVRTAVTRIDYDGRGCLTTALCCRGSAARQGRNR